jgi:hypothetical protein
VILPPLVFHAVAHYVAASVTKEEKTSFKHFRQLADAVHDDRNFLRGRQPTRRANSSRWTGLYPGKTGLNQLIFALGY